MYGRKDGPRRQRYLCFGDDGDSKHVFTPPLPREHVHSDGVVCPVCDSSVGPNHGQRVFARKTTWPLRVVAEGASRLASGESYAGVGNWALRKAQATGRNVRERPTNVAWHIGADWTEAVSPVLFDAVDARLRDSAMQERARLDSLLEDGLPLDRPQVVIVDDLPVYGRQVGTTTRQQFGFYVLVLAEVVWSPPPRTKLRLVRAIPIASTAGWALVFDELGYTPDIVVADGSHSIRNGMRAALGSGPVLLPSLPHINKAITASLVRYRPTMRNTASRRERLIEPIGGHLAKLKKGSEIVTTSAGWKQWWDQLEDIGADMRLPASKIAGFRAAHEPRINARVRDVFINYPNVPASTGAVETLIRRNIQPMLAMRRHSFGNLERTNALFDLVVCRNHDLFDDLRQVEQLLADDAETHSGFTTRNRSVEDRRSVDSRYSSLRDNYLIEQLAAHRGLV